MSSPAEAGPCGSTLAELLLVRRDILLQVRHPRNVAAMGHRGIVQVAAVGRVQVVAGLFMAVEVPALHQLVGSIGEAAAGFLGWIGMALLFGMAERLTVEPITLVLRARDRGLVGLGFRRAGGILGMRLVPLAQRRSAERRVGKGGVRTCR